MKIGIVTVYNSENCGSFLQAYALGKKLEEYGNDVSYVYRDTTNTSHGKKLHFKESVKRLVKFRFAEINREWKRYKNFEKAIQILKIAKSEDEIGSIDMFVLGSDTIWNFDSKYFYNNKERYLGLSFPGKKIISYAASIANTKYDTLRNDSIIREGINNIDRIAVRDQYTKDVVMEIADNKNITIVSDPTLLLKKEDYQKIEAKMDTHNYILLYMFGKIDFDLKNKILEYKAKTNKTIVSFGEYREWADLNIVHDPYMFLYYFNHADRIVTNTFHGTIFSVLFEKQFIDFGGKKKKIEDLLNQINLSNQICNDCKQFEQIIDAEIDYKKVKSIIEEMRDVSLKYLELAIEDV